MGHERSSQGSDDSFAGDFRLAPRKGLRQLGTFQYSLLTTTGSCWRRFGARGCGGFRDRVEVSVGALLPVVRETNPDVVLLDMRMPLEARRPHVSRAPPQARSDRGRDPLELQRRGQHRGCAGGRRARLHRQDDQAGGSPQQCSGARSRANSLQSGARRRRAAVRPELRL